MKRPLEECRLGKLRGNETEPQNLRTFPSASTRSNFLSVIADLLHVLSLSSTQRLTGCMSSTPLAHVFPSVFLSSVISVQPRSCSRKMSILKNRGLSFKSVDRNSFVTFIYFRGIQFFPSCLKGVFLYICNLCRYRRKEGNSVHLQQVLLTDHGEGKQIFG